MSEPKPCPWGCPGEPEVYGSDFDGWFVWCRNPPVHASVSRRLGTREEAVAAWNARPTEDALAEALKRVVRALRKMGWTCTCDDECPEDGCAACMAEAVLRKAGRL